VSRRDQIKAAEKSAAPLVKGILAEFANQKGFDRGIVEIETVEVYEPRRITVKTKATLSFTQGPVSSPAVSPTAVGPLEVGSQTTVVNAPVSGAISRTESSVRRRIATSLGKFKQKLAEEAVKKLASLVVAGFIALAIWLATCARQ
jgi:hypothetical protein